MAPFGSCFSRPHLPFPPTYSQVQELTKKNERLILALDDANKQLASLSGRFEAGGPGPAADARESKIVEVSKKNRTLTLAVEKERAEKLRAQTQLQLAQTELLNLKQNAVESEVERACREVVEQASKATEQAQIELAAVTEKWKLASANAQRFSGQKATLKTENERYKQIIRREIGEHVDFGRLDDAIAATGGKEGRAVTIRELRHKVGYLRVQLNEANDALAVVAAGPEMESGTDDVPTLEDDGNGGGDAELSKETLHETLETVYPGDADADAHKQSTQTPSALLASTMSKDLKVTEARLDVSQVRVEELLTELENVKLDLSAEKEVVTQISKQNRNLETEVNGLLKKVAVLKDKSDHDEKLVNALRDETRRLQMTSRGTSVVSESESEYGGYERNPGRGNSVPSGDNAVPLSVYAALENKAAVLERELRVAERETNSLRQHNMSLEQALQRALHNDCHDVSDTQSVLSQSQFTVNTIAAAAGALSPSDEQDKHLEVHEDVANLIAHSETLERVCAAMRSKLVVAEKQVDQLREQVREEKWKYQDTVSRVERAAGAGGTGAAGDGDIAALRFALEEQKSETMRVKHGYQEKLEGMEKEVELYAEMMTELKREAAANRNRGGSPAPRKGLPG